ncbi:MAG TPA: LysR family transcriptional regulator [Gammaproteobacteria bacterium]|nr:LysR family transcriptional regulator [Gammaproteobacteria bacterium]
MGLLMATIDRNAMALFVKVVENHSFSRTAQRENVPVSTVSRKISELEKALGVRLLERSTRQLRLTEMGQAYYERCRRGVEEFEAANLLINDRQNEVSGTLRLSAPPNLSEVLVVPLVSGFQALYPNVSVQVLIADRYVHLIEDGIDLALRVGELDDSSLVARRLLRYRHVLVASPDYLKRVGHLQHPKDLYDHPLIAFGFSFGETAWTLTNGKKKEKVLVKPKFSINDFNGIQQAVLDGLGIAEIPSILCGKQLTSRQLVEVIPDWHFESVTLSAVYSARVNLARIVCLFKDFCVEHIDELVSHTRC